MRAYSNLTQVYIAAKRPLARRDSNKLEVPGMEPITSDTVDGQEPPLKDLSDGALLRRRVFMELDQAGRLTTKRG